jgi:archaellum component FlaC
MLRQNQRLLELNKRIQDIETDLTRLRHTYKEGYPDIRIANQSLNDLKKERDELQAKQDEELAKPQEPARKTTNYARLAAVTDLEGQINTTRAMMRNLQTSVDNEKRESRRKRRRNSRSMRLSSRLLPGSRRDTRT